MVGNSMFSGRMEIRIAFCCRLSSLLTLGNLQSKLLPRSCKRSLHLNGGVPKMISTTNCIVVAAKARVAASGKKEKHFHQEKFGVKIPHSVQEALKLDTENGDSLWKKAINKEMANVHVTFDVWNEGIQEEI
jgi:hypothetical protein